jgi:hypothetical protein
LPLVSLIPVANLLPVLLIPVVHLTCEKIQNGPNGILWGRGGNRFMKNTRSKKSRDTVPLKDNVDIFPFQVESITACSKSLNFNIFLYITVLYKTERLILKKRLL